MRRLEHEYFAIRFRVLVGGILQDVFHLPPCLSAVAGAIVADLDIAVVEFEKI